MKLINNISKAIGKANGKGDIRQANRVVKFGLFYSRIE